VDAGLSMDDLLDDVEIADSNPCPKCGQFREAGAVVCFDCGYNSQTGSTINTRILKTKVRKQRTKPPISMGWIFLLAGLIAMSSLWAMAWNSESAAGPALIIAGLWVSLASIMMTVAAFKDGDTKWGIISLCSFVPVLGGIFGFAFMLYYCTVGSQRTGWKTHYWMSVVTVVGIALIVASQYPGFLAGNG
jgi:hypothetical protein